MTDDGAPVNVSWVGGGGPAGAAPPRTAGSVRRTSSVDVVWHDVVGGDRSVLGRGRDLLTDGSGTATVTGTAAIDVSVVGGEISALRTTPEADVQALVGSSARSLRYLLADGLATVEDGSMLALLLDEIPASLVFGGAAIARAAASSGAPAPPIGRGPKPDVCAGWAVGGEKALLIKRGLSAVSTVGPTGPDLRGHDPAGWHEEPPVPPTSMRRRRRLDLRRSPDGAGLVVDAFFRDSYVESAAREVVVHEYGLVATIDARSLTVTTATATPHVLPGRDCTGAAASAQRLVGMDASTLRTEVRAAFSGPTTCTHLNDQLRAIGDIGALLAHLDPPPAGR